MGIPKPFCFSCLAASFFKEYDIKKRSLKLLLLSKNKKIILYFLFITEELKRRDMFEWVGKRNNLKNRVREIIFHDYIYI
ncbi:MAG TPA: hypothetical protein DCG28_03910 [Lachnospiraceae bacterium]|nr:hypothetical protein [Lachnospiraceae bacterium]